MIVCLRTRKGGLEEEEEERGGGMSEEKNEKDTFTVQVTYVVL